jgi:hypothetical protein
MFLKRNKAVLENLGVYQATSLLKEGPDIVGLRVGGYFISLEACVYIKNHFQSTKLKKKNVLCNTTFSSPSSSTNLQFPQQAVSICSDSQNSLLNVCTPLNLDLSQTPIQILAPVPVQIPVQIIPFHPIVYFSVPHYYKSTINFEHYQ